MEASHYARVLNFGHRGASGLAPENTLAAFRLARQLGADGVECDVQLTRDGEVVVCHDEDVERVSDGRGRLSTLTLAELKQLDFGAWFGAAFAGERILTLQEMIDGLDAGALLNIELKTMALRSAGLEAQTAAIIRRNNLYGRLIVSSFNPLALWRIHRIDPRIDLGLLYWPGGPLYLRRAWARRLMPFQAMHPEHRMVDERYVRWARRAGYRVNVWTADEPAEMRRLIQLGVNLIITNRPDVLREALRHAGHRS